MREGNEKLRKRIVEAEVERDRALEEKVRGAKYWKEWAKKEVQSRAEKMVAAERKRRQSKGKALPVEMATSASQTDHTAVVLLEVGVQTEEVKVEVAQGTDKATQGTDNEDVVMKDRHEVTELEEWQPYEDLSSYEEEDIARVAAPPATKKTGCPTSGSKGWQEVPTSQKPPSHISQDI